MILQMKPIKLFRNIPAKDKIPKEVMPWISKTNYGNSTGWSWLNVLFTGWSWQSALVYRVILTESPCLQVDFERMSLFTGWSWKNVLVYMVILKECPCLHGDLERMSLFTWLSWHECPWQTRKKWWILAA